MPGLARRREMDLRSQRFESEVRISDMQKMKASPTHLINRTYKCSRCHHLFEERSRYCPRCDTKSMGEIKAIPEQHRQRANENAVRRLRRKHGF